MSVKYIGVNRAENGWVVNFDFSASSGELPETEVHVATTDARLIKLIKAGLNVTDEKEDTNAN